MIIPSYDSSMILAILPEILILVLAIVILAIDLIWRPSKHYNLGWISAAGFLAIMVVAVFISRPEPAERLIFGGMLRQDWPAFTFRLLFLFSAGITSLLSVDTRSIWTRG